ITDDIGKLYCLDGQTGKQYWKYNYGRNSRGSPVLADGKIYIAEVNSFFHILKPGLKKCELLYKQYFAAHDGVSDVEINGSPAIANGRIYFSTSDEILCIGLKNVKNIGLATELPPRPKLGKIAHLQIVPAEIALHSGQSATFSARAFDSDGNFIKEVKAEWSLPAPTLPKGVKGNPPALKGDIT